MKRVRTPGLAFAVLASAGCLFAQDAGKPFKDLPGAGKPVRAGVLITTEGGVEGPQSIYYAEGADRKGKGEKLDPNSRKGLPPIATAENPGVVNAGGRFKNSDTPVDMMDYGADPVVGRLTSKDADVADRRFGTGPNERFSKDDKFAGKDRPEFGRWGREGERRDRDSSEYFGTGDKYDTSARPAFGRWAREDERRDRDAYARSGDRADVRNWNEMFSRDKTDRYADRDRYSPLTGEMNDTVKRMQAYEQVSMQAINRTAFRRSHSDSAGGTPVAPVGGGPDGVRPMSASKAGQ